MAAPAVLFVLTNNDKLGNTGQQTGWYLNEVAQPWREFADAGYLISVISPNGGFTPMDPKSVVEGKDKVSQEFLKSAEGQRCLQNTLRPDQVRSQDFSAIFFPGGHGPLWDLPDNAQIQSLVRDIYEHGGVVSAVCHGPAALVNVKLSNGRYLVAGKRVSAFTDEEEEAVGQTAVVPFSVERVLKERGAVFKHAGRKWGSHVEEDEGLVTGQNPASAEATAKAAIKMLKDRNMPGMHVQKAHHHSDTHEKLHHVEEALGLRKAA